MDAYDIFEDSLGVTCYNTGEDGNGIILCYGFLKMITQRYSPKLIIYDVTGFDFLEDDNMKYLDLMKPYYYEPGIDSVFWSVNPKTQYMMLSNLYRYNTTCLKVLGSFIHPMTNYPKGYSALYKTMDYEPVIKNPESKMVDSLKIVFFKKFFQLAKGNGIKLICCVSPIYKASTDNSYYESVKEICLQHGVPFLYYNTDSDFTNEKSFFKDRMHLNDKGARLYTRKVISWLKKNYSVTP